jgi:hypothetical protein
MSWSLTLIAIFDPNITDTSTELFEEGIRIHEKHPDSTVIMNIPEQCTVAIPASMEVVWLPVLPSRVRSDLIRAKLKKMRRAKGSPDGIGHGRTIMRVTILVHCARERSGEVWAEDRHDGQTRRAASLA